LVLLLGEVAQVNRVTEKSIGLFLAALVLGLIIGLGLGYAFPIEAGILTEQQVRETIRQSPGWEDLDVKPETIRFLSLSLGLREGERVWVAEYECAGRYWLVGRMSTPPYARIFMRVVMNARTGERVFIESHDLPFPENLLTAEDVRSKIVEELDSRDPYVLKGLSSIELKRETVEFRSFVLVCSMRHTPSETYRWFVEFEGEGRSRGGLVGYNLITGEIEEVEPSFKRMLFRMTVDARSGKLGHIGASSLDIIDRPR